MRSNPCILNGRLWNIGHIPHVDVTLFIRPCSWHACCVLYDENLSLEGRSMRHRNAVERDKDTQLPRPWVCCANGIILLHLS